MNPTKQIDHYCNEIFAIYQDALKNQWGPDGVKRELLARVPIAEWVEVTKIAQDTVILQHHGTPCDCHMCKALQNLKAKGWNP